MNESDQSSKGLAQIDENIKRVYQEALKDELPDKFHQLLAKLRAQDAAGSGQPQ